MNLTQIISHCEKMLASYYGFSLQANLSDFLVTNEEMKTQIGESDDLPRTGVFVVEGESDQDTFVGVHLAHDIHDNLLAANPLKKLQLENLEAFCVLIEEISHFHLIMNRAHANLGVSKVELEWQAEIDKIVFAAELLKAQSGRSHLGLLLRVVFDRGSVISKTEPEVYEEASKYAAQFWYKAIQNKNEERAIQELQALLQELYRKNWSDKQSFLLTRAA